MSQRLKAIILKHVTHRAYEPRPIQALANDLGLDSSDVDALREVVNELVKEQRIILGSENTVALPPIGREVIGRFKKNERGFGFIIPDTPNEHGHLFVPAKDTNEALSGDIVRAKVKRRGGKFVAGRSPFVGRIVEVVQRAHTHFVGELKQKSGIWVVEVDGGVLPHPVVIHDHQAKGAKPGNKVAVELTQYPEGSFLAEGVITKVLGEAGEPDVETEGICIAYSLRQEFPEDVLQNARDIVRDYNDPKTQTKFFKDREDIRDLYICTIDPPDAKDFDDAISIEKTSKGTELGIHIADVAGFIESGSPIDLEAYDRGNSTYLPRLVVPMLPEVLSNGICSLQPGVPRLTRSVFITYDNNGAIVQTRFARTIIQSNHRMTYIEAQALIDGDEKLAREHAKYDQPYTPELINTVKKMDSLAKIIRKRRMKDGMIVLDLPEVELIHDDDGHVIDATPEDNAFTHQIIEAFMVEANEAVAQVFANIDVPLIRRIHPEPSSHDTDDLRAFARVAGFNIPSNPTRKELQGLIEAVRGKPASRAVHFGILRTLTRAEYAPDLLGHFALASEHYTHFTSPIRRYPDLAVHRAMDGLIEVLNGKPLPKDTKAKMRLGKKVCEHPKVLLEQQLRELGQHCSRTERNSEAAERELRNLLVLQLLVDHVGDVYPGTVTGVVNSGIFVQIDKYLVEGMIRQEDLPGGREERWTLNKNTGSLTAERSGYTITIGDQFKVMINKVDIARRNMDLLIADGRYGKPPKPSEAGRDSKPRQSKQGGKSGKPRNSKSSDKPFKGKKKKGRKGGKASTKGQSNPQSKRGKKGAPKPKRGKRK